ncbi:MAG: hydroxymethylbilane synthase [Acidimicrobiales bacterium]|nr:hydroxymethylbilane synthase [Acidimicrobiales bacterium]
MAERVLRAATRQSPLALWQANHVRDLLQAAHPGLAVELVSMETEGDQRPDVPISAIGGKGVFAKEVQHAVLEGRADFAVHSAKDLPAVTVDGLRLAAVPERGDSRDALVGATLDDLAQGATVATGSQRRRVQLGRLRPDLVFTELRGNMATRLEKVPEGGAIVVAVAAFQRLGLDEHLAQRFEVEEMVPQVGQGALAIECRSGDAATAELLAAIEHRSTRHRVDAERAFLAELGGDCDLPAGAHARFVGVQDEGLLVLDAFLATAGTHDATVVRHHATADDPEALGHAVARHLRQALGPNP